VIESAPLPATSQVAQQEGKYLAKALTRRARNQPVEPFQYKHLGMLAYIGGDRALADLESVKGRGWVTWLFWRSAYLSRIVSLKNKTLVLFDWIKGQIFGRDISQF
jgi:NADH dehydrogenase FAD-containing subunit